MYKKRHYKQSAFKPPLSLAIALVLCACAPGDEGSTIGNDQDDGGDTIACAVLDSGKKDTDNDGLPDCYEKTIGTSPADVDSDGDGLTDYDEVVVKAFDASINNFQFNPRIADVPEISVKLQSLPEISVNFTDSSNTSQTRSLTNGSRNSSTVSSTDTHEQSVGEEVSGTIGASASFPGFGLSSSTTYTKNQQETLSWSQSQARENETFRENTKSQTSEQGVTNASGDINVLLKVKNNGYQTVTLSNLTLTALEVNPNNPTQPQLVSGLDYDTSAGSFPTFDIAPNAESNMLPFRAELSLGKTYDLLKDSRNLSIEPTTWNITDQDGRSYTHELTNVGARSARVVIDYAGAGNRGIEYHYVATVTDFGQNRISAAKALGDILNIQFAEGNSSSKFSGPHSGLLSVRNIDNDDSIDARWIVIHNYLDTDGVTHVKSTYDISQGTYSLNNIALAKGETLHLMYREDKDGDGLGSREEFIHGTSDSDTDSDDDGLTDFEEIKEGWQIPVTRTLSRQVFSNPIEKDGDNDALLDGAERTKGTNPSVRDTDSDGILDYSDTQLTVADMQESAFLPLSQVNVVDHTINGSTSYTGSFDFTTDRFGTASAAALISDGPSQMIDVTGFMPFEPTVGASVVFWFKPDPSVPGIANWTLYEHAGSPATAVNSIADQWFVVGQSDFIVMGDANDRHSIWPGSNNLFTGYDLADWHMLAIVADDEMASNDVGMNRYQVYLDGQLYGSIVNNSPLVRFYPAASWTFAGQSSYSFGDYIGGIDDIRFFTRALDREEIQMLLTEGQ